MGAQYSCKTFLPMLKKNRGKKLNRIKIKRSCMVLPRIAMTKKGIHPVFYPEAKVLCNGEVVVTLGGSQEEYVVDLWSGNHPFFQGATNTVVVDEGQVNRFRKRFAGLDDLSTVQTVSSTKTTP